VTLRSRTAIGAGGGLLAVALIVAVVVSVGGRATAPSATPSTPSVFLAGVDVSSHDDPIDWEAAARSGVRFVVARASEGDSRVDTAYPSVRDAARAAGVAVTAFHYARPDREKGDAVREADLLVDSAGLASGDLVPVLDLEESGGLGSLGLQRWVTAWVQEVERRLGAKPLIYTNLDFWRTHMGDTTMFAEAGYPLYVASWGATEPAVPAVDWGGRGWTLWQTAECGSVGGIEGCIRTDLFDGADLTPLRIP
jgi:lysozyme